MHSVYSDCHTCRSKNIFKTRIAQHTNNKSKNVLQKKKTKKKDKKKRQKKI